MPERFSTLNYHFICDQLAAQDNDLGRIISLYGYPPLWSRPNTFESLVHIILEQQVSLASALSTLNKLKDKVGEVSPVRILLLTDAELRDCYFSRQKSSYVRYLAEAMVSGQIDLAAFEEMEDAAIRTALTALKGIGNWTVDIYLMFVLHHTDIFPSGDLAAVNALKHLKSLNSGTAREEVTAVAAQWQPYRTVATMLLWHYYLNR